MLQKFKLFFKEKVATVTTTKILFLHCMFRSAQKYVEYHIFFINSAKNRAILLKFLPTICYAISK